MKLFVAVLVSKRSVSKAARLTTSFKREAQDFQFSSPSFLHQARPKVHLQIHSPSESKTTSPQKMTKEFPTLMSIRRV